MIQEIQKLLDALDLRHSREAIAAALQHAQKTKPSYSTFLLNLLREEHQDQRRRSSAPPPSVPT